MDKVQMRPLMLLIPPNTEEELNRLVLETGADDIYEIIKFGVQFLSWAVAETIKGNEVVALHPDDETMTQIADYKPITFARGLREE